MNININYLRVIKIIKIIKVEYFFLRLDTLM
jgi:hypothetical protein